MLPWCFAEDAQDGRKPDLQLLWFYDEGRLVVCTHGFVKSTRKTPAAEIERARSSSAAYRAAKKDAQLTVED